MLCQALTGSLEKHSAVLGRNAVWSRTSKISRLPQYLSVQLLRFYWKPTPESRDHVGVKCKMLRVMCVVVSRVCIRGADSTELPKCECVPARNGLALPRESHYGEIALAGSCRLLSTLAAALVLFAHAVVTVAKSYA